MISFAALNKEDSGSISCHTPRGKHRSNPTKEAQESAILQLYHGAMRKQQEGDLEGAELMYHEILDSQLISPIGPSFDAMANTLYRVKFLILKNIASIAKDKDEIPRAISAYLEASEYNSDDSTLLYQLALCSVTLGDMALARPALEQVLHINPRYMPAITLLFKVLLATGDYLACVDLAVAVIEQDSQFKTAFGLIQYCLKLCPDFLTLNPLLTKYLMKPTSYEADKLIVESKQLCIKYTALKNVSVLTETIVPPCKPTAFNLESLGIFLINVYKHCKDISRKHNRPSLCVSVDLYTALDGVQEEPLSVESTPIKVPTITTKEGLECGDKRKRRLASETDGGYHPKRRSTRQSKGSFGIRREHHDFLRIINKYLPPVYRLVVLPDPAELIEVPEIQQRTKRTDEFEATALDEVNEVKQFVEDEMTNSGIVQLMFDFLWLLSSHYQFKWSKLKSSTVVKRFIECYELIHNQISFPVPFSKMNTEERNKARKLFMISLCYAELSLDALSTDVPARNKSKCGDHTHLPALMSDCMLFLRCTPVSVFDDYTEQKSVALRVHWINVKLHLLKKQCEEATIVIDQCLELLNDISGSNQESCDTVMSCQGLIIHLANCSSSNIVSLEKVLDKKKSIMQATSLKNVFTLYKEKSFVQVIDILAPILQQECGSQSEFFLTLFDETTPSSNDQPSVQLLLLALMNINRIEESFEYCLHSLIEVLAYYSSHGGSDSFTAALTFYCDFLSKCLKSDTDLLSKVPYKIVQNFVTSMIKVLDITQESFDTLALTEVMYILPWKLLHTVISCDSLPGIDSTECNMEEGLSASASTSANGDGMCNASMDKETFSEDPLMISQQSSVDHSIHMTVDSIKTPTESTVHLTQQTDPTDTQQPLLDPELVTDTQVPMEQGSVDKGDTENTCGVDSNRIETGLPSNAEQSIQDSVVDTVSEAASPPTTTLVTSSVVSVASFYKSSRNTSLSPIKQLSATPTPPNTVSVPTSPHPSPSIRQTTPSSPLLSFPSSSMSPSVTTKVSPLKSCTISPVFDYIDRKQTGLRFLHQAHSVLGSFGYCTADKGSLLKFIVSILHQELRELTALPKELREILLVELEQCYYCMYGYPYKKAKTRGLTTEHQAEQISLTWESSVLLLEYFHPSCLPSVDEPKSPHITTELMTLYKKILEVLPEDGRVIGRTDLLGYIDSAIDTLPQPSDPTQYSCLIGGIYYLLADDSLRSYDNQNGVKYYQHCLSYQPESFDAWAGLSIAMSQRICEKVDQRDTKATVEKFVQKKTSPTIRCFIETLKLNHNCCYVVEKFGFFVYTIYSFMIQIKKQPCLYKSKQTQEWANDFCEKMLIIAEKQFTHAITLNGTKHYEPWIYHFMLGKILTKLKKEPKQILDHFIKSTDILHAEGASYPMVVEINSKGHAVQALEVHYQFLSVILKYLFSSLNDQTEVPNPVLIQAITSMQNYPLGRITHQPLWEWAINTVSRYNKDNNNSTVEAMDTAKIVIAESIQQDNSLKLESKPMQDLWQDQAPGLTQENIDSVMDTDVNPMDVAITELNNDPVVMSECVNEAEDELILVDECSGSDSPKSIYETSAIEMMANTASPDHSPLSVHSPMSRFSGSNPDPLTEAVYGIAMCAVRFPAYFKPLYQLAKTLYTMGYPSEAKKFLLGPIPKCFTDIQDKLVPLFALRSNIYQNMWQIQVYEINRPGNFSSHARSCLELLMDILVATDDFSSLFYITQQLKLKLESSKQYMRECDRQSMFVTSLIHCAKVLKAVTVTFNDSPGRDSNHFSKMLMDAYSLRNMVSKVNEPFKENVLKDLEYCMIKLFTHEWSINQQLKYMFPDKQSSDISFDLCLKYCQKSKV